MPRKSSGKHEAQRERTRRYRRRLRSTGTPEADAVDVAVAAAVAAMAEAVRLRDEKARAAVTARRAALRTDLDLGVLSDEEAETAFAELMLPPVVPAAEPLAPDAFVRRLMHGAVALLVDKNCDPAQAKRKVRQRLGRGGDPTELEKLIHRSGVSIDPKRLRKTSRGYAP